MFISIWIHIGLLAFWQYSQPETSPPLPPPIILELETAPPDEPDPKEPPPAAEPEPAPAEQAKPMDEPALKDVPLVPDQMDAVSDDGQPAGESADDGFPLPEVNAAPVLPADTDQLVKQALEDTISLESRAPRYMSYLAQVKSGVAKNWVFPPEARDRRQSGQVRVVFTVDRQGNLVKIKVEQSSGSEILDRAALAAIEKAAPFAPFPEHINLELLNIKANFDYRIKYIKMN